MQHPPRPLPRGNNIVSCIKIFDSEEDYRSAIQKRFQARFSAAL
jgi:hypothetical protein